MILACNVLFYIIVTLGITDVFIQLFNLTILNRVLVGIHIGALISYCFVATMTLTGKCKNTPKGSLLYGGKSLLLRATGVSIITGIIFILILTKSSIMRINL